MGEWDWELTETARWDFVYLDDYARERIASKLDEIVTDQWRDPTEYLEPLRVLRIRNSASVRFDSAAGLTVVVRPSMSFVSESVVETHIEVTTINEFSE